MAPCSGPVFCEIVTGGPPRTERRPGAAASDCAMAHSVFLSYSQKDKRTAEAVCRALEANDVRVWMAPRDIPPGATWPESIPVAIDAARVMVLIFSESANSSNHIAREIDIACDRKLTIIPVRIENVALGGSLRYFLGTSQWFDAFPGPMEPHLTRLVATVRKSLGVQPRAQSPAIKTTPNRPSAAMSIPGALAPSAAQPQFFAGAAALAPAGYKSPQLLVGIGALALLAAAAAFFYLNRDVAAPPPVSISANPTPIDTDCTKMNPPCSTVADVEQPPLPGNGEITGFANVLSASTLAIKEKRIELANVAPAPPSSAKQLQDWIEVFGYSVRCRPAPHASGKYFCDVGPTHIDLSTQVLRQGWAKPISGAPVEMPPN
jgi:hypothetical protein